MQPDLMQIIVGASQSEDCLHMAQVLAALHFVLACVSEYEPNSLLSPLYHSMVEVLYCVGGSKGASTPVHALFAN